MSNYLKETVKYSLRCNALITPFVKEVERLFRLSEEELHKECEAKFIKIFRKAITKSPFYKKLYSEHGISINDINSIGDLSKLPVVEKQMFNKDSTQLLTIPKLFLSKSVTSGTTGAPMVKYNDYFSVLREQAYLYVYRKKRGFTYGDKLVSLRGHLGRKLLKLKVDVSNTLYLSSFQINQDTFKKYYDEILSFAPVAIEGYPSSLYNLCWFFKEQGWKLSIPKCFTSSETLFDFQRKLIEETLNTEIYDHYGNAERTIALSECLDHRGYFSLPGYSINEFQDDCVITTALINSSFPLIRYKVTDIISLSPKPSFANSELCVAKSIDGRLEDSIIAKDGSVIALMTTLTDGVDNIKIAQVIQKERGFIQINVVPDGNFFESDKINMIKNIDARIGLDNIDFNIDIVDDSKIIYTKRNKYKYTISLLDK